ncbi:MAG: hypothetical protein ACTSRA_02025 [Promethearchaeota archaeon]
MNGAPKNFMLETCVGIIIEILKRKIKFNFETTARIKIFKRATSQIRSRVM